MESTDRFYEDLSAHYHLLFDDWDQAVTRQGRDLDGLIARILGPGPRSILDAACGIGTQAIGLALRGHRVGGCDLSAAALARAEREAGRFGVNLDLREADLRRLSAAVEGPFDVAVVLDNALAHLFGPEDLAAAVGELAASLAPGGLLLASIRDYDRVIEERPAATPLRVLEGGEGRRILFQTWDWEPDSGAYEVTQYILRHRAGGVDTLAFTTRMRALTRAALDRALGHAKLQDLRWLTPEESGFYQPIVTARCP